ncbi:stathmin domain-containing protein 1 [Ambystoma mexicanum]|uniref:stathmin domain-containing protein 1 n=1 Tax=Ambystoma mexicanum TaxID=8296 RepID=UPI0037E869DC
MGCADSKVKVVRPKESRQTGWAEGGKANKDKEIHPDKQAIATPRDGSALSKGTMDSGVGFEDEPVPGSVPGMVVDRVASPRDRHDGLQTERSLLGGGFTSQQGPQERAKSSDILEELMMQGIIQSQTKFVRNGEAYDVMMDAAERPLKRPPAKLEKLKSKKKKKKTLTKEDIDNKIRAAEERRKYKEEELKKRLRTERPFTAHGLQPIAEYRGEGDSAPEEEEEEEGPRSSARSRATALDFDQEPERQKQVSFLETALQQEERRSHLEDTDISGLEADETYNQENYAASDSASDIF